MGCSMGTYTLEYLPPNFTIFLNTDELLRDRSVAWFDVLPNGQVLLLSGEKEHSTSQLSIYSVDKKTLATVDLPLAVSADKTSVENQNNASRNDIHSEIRCSCSHRSKMGDYRVIVALKETHQLQIVNVQDGTLNKGAVIDVNVVPRLVSWYSASSVIILAQEEDTKWCFRILDLAGRVQKHTLVNHARLKSPAFMHMSRDRHEVFILDPFEGCFGFSLDGEVMFHYTNPKARLYLGLAMDPNGDLYFNTSIKGDVSTRMIKLSPVGLVLRHSNVGDVFPLACTGDKLYVSAKNDQYENIIGYVKV